MTARTENRPISRDEIDVLYREALGELEQGRGSDEPFFSIGELQAIYGFIQHLGELLKSYQSRSTRAAIRLDRAVSQLQMARTKIRDLRCDWTFVDAWLDNAGRLVGEASVILDDAADVRKVREAEEAASATGVEQTD